MPKVWDNIQKTKQSKYLALPDKYVKPNLPMLPNPVNSCSGSVHAYFTAMTQNRIWISSNNTELPYLLFGQIKSALFKVPIWVFGIGVKFFFQAGINLVGFAHIGS